MHNPISAVLPIFNCKERLERHLRSVTVWADSVEEIIVVDSGSSDGSLELAKSVLSTFRATFIHHPPGLYQSWNAGIAAASAPWCYIATVEDPITPQGLHHLLDVATRHDADVTISPPEMRSADGLLPATEMMPSNRVAEAFLATGISDRLLGRAETIALLCGLLPHGLLGSSASNLYRTSFLQRHPFPTNFGHCGDTAWGVTVAPFVNAAFTPVQCARFYCQTNFRAEDPQTQLSRHLKLAEATRTALTATVAENPELGVMLGWFDSHDHSTRVLWNWLSEQRAYQEHLNSKYEGGVLQYLRRAFRDEWKKFFPTRNEN